MSYLNIAWSNLLRNRRRTLSTLAAISVGVSMIVFTNSFTDGISANMSDSIINQIDGHLRIQHRDYKKFYITDQEKILISDYRTLASAVAKIPHVRTVMPRVMLGGLMGKDDKSTTFFGMASDLATLNTVLPDYGKDLVAGKLLSDQDPDGVIIGQALAKSLNVSVGDELVLLSKTVHGDQSNALVHVRGITTFPTDYVVEQSLILGGLGKTLKEDLLDIGEGATQLVVRLDDTDNVAEVERSLNQYFERNHMPWQVTPWSENPVYSRVVGMFNGIGGFIMFVLTLMVGVITSNALLMAFFERIREIGTLRAIGMRKAGVYQLLYIESAIVGAVGTMSGLILGMAATAIAWYVGIPVGLVGQIIHPVLNSTSMLVSATAPIICIVVAAAIPIRAAVRMSVIESLNYQ